MLLKDARTRLQSAGERALRAPMMSESSRVNIFQRRRDGFLSPALRQSESRTSVGQALRSALVIIAMTHAPHELWKEEAERTRAGRVLLLSFSMKGNGTSTTVPGSKIVIEVIFPFAKRGGQVPVPRWV